MEITRVGLGGWAIGGGGGERCWGRQHDDESIDPILPAATLEHTDEDAAELEGSAQ